MKRRDFVVLALLVGLLVLVILQVVAVREPRRVDDRTLPPVCGDRTLPSPDGEDHLLPTVDLTAIPTPALIVTPAAGGGAGFG